MKKMVINHPAVWIAAVLSQVILALWYRGFLWMGYETLPERIRDTDPALALYLVGLLGALIAMYVLEWILIRLNIDSAREGLVAGLMIGVVFNIFSLITIYSFAEEPIEIAMIDFGANALVFLFAGLLLGAWRKYQ